MFSQTTKTEIRDIFQLSIPIIISQVGYMLMGFSDNLMVGSVSPAALAACGVSNSVFFLVVVIGIGGLSVLAPMVSKGKEEGLHAHCGSCLKAGLAVSFLYSFLIIFFLSLFIYYFDLLGQKPDVALLSKEYLAIITISVLPMMLFMALKQFTDGLENTKVGMYVSLSGLVVNVLLCYVFIYGHFGIPAMGLNGAGLATLLTRVFMFAAMYWYVKTSKDFIQEMQGFTTSIAKVKDDCLQLLQKGLPAGFQMLAECSAFCIAAIMVGWISTADLAAHQIVLSWAGLSYMISSGISIAVSIRVGAGLGAKSKQRILLSTYVGMGIVVIYECLTLGGFVIGREYLAQLFTIDPEVMAIAPTLMILMGLFQLPDGIQVVWLGALRGLLDVKLPTYIVLFAYTGVCLPLAYLLAFTFGFGTKGIWFGLVIGLLISAILNSFRFFWFTKRLKFEVEITKEEVVD